MDIIDIKGPTLPESVANAELKEWLVAPNQQVSLNDNLVIIESEKVSFEIPAPEDGYISELLVKPGDTVLSEQVLARFTVAANKAAPASTATISATTETSATTPSTTAPETVATATTAKVPTTSQDTLADEMAPDPVSAGKPVDPALATNASRHAQGNNYRSASSIPSSSMLNENETSLAAKSLKLGPKARRLVMEYGSSSEQVEQYLKQRIPPRIIASEVKLRRLTEQLEPEKTRVPMTNIRKHIAQRLLESKNSTAMLTTFNEVDLQKIVDIRKTYGEAFSKKHNVRLGFMSFFVRAVTEAMKEFPIISACIEGDDIVYSTTTDISIAVSTDRGLVTPVLRGTEFKTLADIERDIAEFAKRANNNKLTIEDMTGGNFTITNGGVFGSLFSTPIINPPQSAILGMHGIKKRPVVVNDEIVIRPMMYIALSYDHRLIDGKDSVRFLAKVKALLEDPTSMLLDI